VRTPPDKATVPPAIDAGVTEPTAGVPEVPGGTVSVIELRVWVEPVTKSYE
jgi:hypothetical protein